MTELFIDGIPVVLPKSMNLEVKRENPLFTKNGEYTYDLTLSLENKTNAELYKHLGRLNSVAEITGNRTAVLIADNRVYCNGIEIIEGWTDKTVTIQIASGNSELNYFIGSDVLISTLDIYDKSPLTAGTPDLKWVKNRYPDIDFCLSPVTNDTAGTIINEWRLNNITATNTWRLDLKPDFTADDYIPQPFLCAFIKKLLSALSYDLVENMIENTVWKDLYIVHINNTTNWAKMLPGWTVAEFLEQVENLFNMTFIIDAKTKKVRLLFNNAFYLNATVSHVTSVVDEYETEVDEENQTLTNTSNVKYAFPDTAYYRRQCLPDHIRSDAKRTTVPADFMPGDPGYLRFYISQHRDPQAIYTDQRKEKDFILSINAEDGILRKINMVDEFKGILREGATNTIELEMIPATIRDIYLDIYVNGVMSTDRHIYVQRPVVESANDTPEEEEEEKSIQTLLDEGKSKPSESKSAISLAFYHALNNEGEEYRVPANIYPSPFTNDLANYGLSYTPTNADGATLRLSKLKEELHSGMYDIDESKAFNITSYDPNLFDPRSVFEIRNKYYVCKEITYSLSPAGRKKPWTGVFHPIRISDAEVHQRWILTDGKWRDGGVWLDNGRWLDE